MTIVDLRRQKKVKDFDLSKEAKRSTSDGRKWYVEDSVQEFINQVKDEVSDLQVDYANLEHCDKDEVCELIDKKAGENFNIKSKEKNKK